MNNSINLSSDELVRRVVKCDYPWHLSQQWKNYRWYFVMTALGITQADARVLCARFGFNADEVLVR